MSSWRDQILREFTPNVARLTLISDPDGLLLEEGILEDIRKRGFELIPFEDHIEFRYAYESKFRSRWDQGERTDLVVVLRSQTRDLGELPFDLLQAGRRLSFSLGYIFPNLSYPVVTSLDKSDLDALYAAQVRHAPGQLGDNTTKEFVLRHVFEIAPELIKQPSDLLRVLIRRHYRNQRIPPELDERFIQLLRQNASFKDWPLERLVTERDTFFIFMQERWPIFLDHLASKATSDVGDKSKISDLSVAGPEDLPFDHDDIRVYIDNLFVEGLLNPVPHDYAESFSKTWVNIGIKTDNVIDNSRRLSKLLKNLQESFPSDDSRHLDWFQFARVWAELILSFNKQADSIDRKLDQQVNNLKEQVDRGFTSWLFKRYGGLVNLPPVPPVMLHHIPRFLAHQLSDNNQNKIALIVIDGLAMDQWLVVRAALSLKQPKLRFREQAVFAWIPSLTSVSRQAAFAGKAPIFFPNSIQKTEKEPVLWTQFWVDNGLNANEVIYLKGLGDGNIEPVMDAISQNRTRIAGLVVDKVDRIMHGMEMGTAGMHNQVGQWINQSFLGSLLDQLLEREFQIYLTSDHGNIEAEGCGRPTEGAVADLRGERVRIYSDPILRNKVKARYSTAIEWGSVGLPDNFLALLAPSRQAFVQKGHRTVCHGGMSIEELIVPFVRIERNMK